MPDSHKEIKLAYRKDEAKKVGAYAIRPELLITHY